jgi:hypothetical protein
LTTNAQPVAAVYSRKNGRRQPGQAAIKKRESARLKELYLYKPVTSGRIWQRSSGGYRFPVELEAQPTVNPEDWAEASSFTVG